MTFSILAVMQSLAALIAAKYPEYPIYINPNQQGTTLPCFFIMLMPSNISSEPDGRYMRDVGIDIVFLQQRNSTGINTEILGVLEFLDLNLETFTYTDESGTSGLIHSYERESTVNDQELHYKLHIKGRVSIPNDEILMQIMEGLDANIKEA